MSPDMLEAQLQLLTRLEAILQGGQPLSELDRSNALMYIHRIRDGLSSLADTHNDDDSPIMQLGGRMADSLFGWAAQLW
jgi:hypothetical protein